MRHTFVARLKINLLGKIFFRDSQNKPFKFDGFCHAANKRTAISAIQCF